LPPIDNQQVVALLRQYDVLAVPSQCQETGPLVVLEAFAAGTPVLGSRLGGIAELVRDEIDGLLVDYDNVASWAQALHRLATESELLTSMQQAIKPPRTVDMVAIDMLTLYRDIQQDDAVCSET
jgi:glycosyltransferase involved in cell wall biosynthesis